MAETQEGRNNLYYNWETGDADWGDKVSENFLNIGMRLYMAVVNRTTTAPPIGETGPYLIPTGATGEWSTHIGEIARKAVFPGTSTYDWWYTVPYAGFLIFDISDNTLYAYNGTSWSTNGFTFTFI